MVARGNAYACYCPFRPVVQNPLYRAVDDRSFTLRALASDGVKLRRVSENAKVERDDPGEITLHCIHLEHVVISVKKKPNQAPEPTPTTVTPPAGQEARQP